jgi:hypothetical protein
MNNLPTNPEPPDELDRLLSEFFKAQLRHPWPNAPVPAAAPASEPSGLVNSRAAEARNEADPARRDGSARARLTLAASVALALGACWALSSGFEPTATPGVAPATPVGPGMLQNGGASGNGHPTLDKLQENKEKDPNGNNAAPKVDAGKLE